MVPGSACAVHDSILRGLSCRDDTLLCLISFLCGPSSPRPPARDTRLSTRQCASMYDGIQKGASSPVAWATNQAMDMPSSLLIATPSMHYRPFLSVSHSSVINLSHLIIQTMPYCAEKDSRCKLSSRSCVLEDQREGRRHAVRIQMGVLRTRAGACHTHKRGVLAP